MAPAPGLTVTLSLDTAELQRDLERIEDGELELPTVSAVRVHCSGVPRATQFYQEIPIWLPAA